MPRADGTFVGVGWSQKRSDAWTRIFTPAAPLKDETLETVRLAMAHVREFDAPSNPAGTPRCPPCGGWCEERCVAAAQPHLCSKCSITVHCASCRPVPTAASREVPARLEDAEADMQAARDGYNPAR